MKLSTNWQRTILLALAAGALWGLGRLLWYDHLPPPIRKITVNVIPARRGPGQPKRLLVFAGSMGEGVPRSMPVLRQLLAEPELAGTDLLTFHEHAYQLTPGPSADYAARLRAEVDAQWLRAGGYDDIILAGASLGSVIVRQAFLASAGRDPRQPRTIPWSDRVSRIVLLAGIGRGITVEDDGPLQLRLEIRFGRFIPYVRRSIAYDQMRGAESISSIRIAWIRYFAELNAAARTDTSVHVPVVVQVLGTLDDLVKRDDNIDLAQFPNAYHLDVPRTHHSDIFSFGPPSDSSVRYTLYREAFLSRQPAHAAPRLTAPDSIGRVIFLLHGLRTTRDSWVSQLGPVLRQRIPNAEVIESSYGKTSLLGFVLPSVRRRERRWLQDQYSEALARHPFATIDVVAHSNGAYILGESLMHMPVMRFDRVALLGSVLPADYPWRARRALGQVGTVRSDRAVDDGVVALLCNGLHGVGMMDVGTSGWQGFDESADFLVEPPWVPGGHDATVAADHLASVADFIATGKVPRATGTVARPALLLRWASALAPWLLFLSGVGAAVLAIVWVRRVTDQRRWLRIAAVSAFALFAAILLDVL